MFREQVIYWPRPWWHWNKKAGTYKWARGAHWSKKHLVRQDFDGSWEHT